MKTIYKYPLEITDMQLVQMPSCSNILCVQLQGDSLCLWAEVCTDEPTRGYTIEIIGTGNPMMPIGFVTRRYISTVQQGPLVWHIFERI